MDLNAKHVLITGAGQRIARAIAETLLRWDIKLTIHYRTSQVEATALKSLAENRGRKAITVAANLDCVAEIRAAVDTAVATFGPVEVLINSAGIFFPTPALTCTEEQWDELLDVNLKGHFFFAQQCANSLLSHPGKKGVILNIADVHGAKPIRQFTAYAASKAGILMMTRNLAKEWAPHIRVNSISPGPIIPPESYNEEQKQASVKHTLLGRWGNPLDIANAALFLIENDYMTGFDLKVDGGRGV